MERKKSTTNKLSHSNILSRVKCQGTNEIFFHPLSVASTNTERNDEDEYNRQTII